MEVTWKDIPGYEGHYQVSDSGSVRSLDRAQTSYGGRAWVRKGAPMKLTRDGRGYMIVTLALEGFRKRRYVHDLVLQAFKGERPSGMHGCHNDGNPANNILTNLRWDTPTANTLDKLTHGTMPLGEHHHKAVYTEPQIREAKRLLATMSVADVHRATGISKGTLSQVKAGRQWAHVH